MKVSINSVHFKTDKKLDDFIVEKVEKLTGLYNGIIGSEVTLRVENSETPDNKIAEIRILIRGYDLFAKKQSSSFEEATDTAVEALRKQLTKHKDKLKKVS
jgi:putative sigma-54 modulation protein